MTRAGVLLLALAACCAQSARTGVAAVSRALPITLDVSNASSYDAVLWVARSGSRGRMVGRLPAQSETRFVLYPDVLPPLTPVYLVAVSRAGLFDTSPVIYATAGAIVRWAIGRDAGGPAVPRYAGP